VVHWDGEVAVELSTELEELKRIREQREMPEILPGCLTKSTPQYRNCPFKDICLETGSWPQTKSGIRIVR